YGMGHAEEILGETLGARRREVVIATKVGADFHREPPGKCFDPDYMRRALEESLARLRTDFIDVYQLHDPTADEVRRPAVQAALRAFIDEGLVRAAGVTVHHLAESEAALESDLFATIQLPYSIATQWLANRVLPRAPARGLGVIAREPLCQGFLSGKYEPDHVFAPSDFRASWPPAHRRFLCDLAARLRVSLRERRRSETPPAAAALQFPLASPAVSTVIVGMKTPAQVDENLAVISLPPLDEKTLVWMRE
ncbi:MAG: aldo/keto reductase, partial [Polyangiaceae bacterium]